MVDFSSVSLYICLVCFISCPSIFSGCMVVSAVFSESARTSFIEFTFCNSSMPVFALISVFTYSSVLKEPTLFPVYVSTLISESAGSLFILVAFHLCYVFSFLYLLSLSFYISFCHMYSSAACAVAVLFSTYFWVFEFAFIPTGIYLSPSVYLSKNIYVQTYFVYLQIKYNYSHNKIKSLTILTNITIIQK